MFEGENLGGTTPAQFSIALVIALGVLGAGLILSRLSDKPDVADYMLCYKDGRVIADSRDGAIAYGTQDRVARLGIDGQLEMLSVDHCSIIR